MPLTRLSLLNGGLGNLWLRASDASAFTIASLLAKTSIAWNVTEEEVPDERGKLIDVIEGPMKFAVDSTLLQSRKTDLDFVVNHSSTQRFVMKYFGVTRDVFQHWLIPYLHISRNAALEYNEKLRTLRLVTRALDDAGVLVIPSYDWPYVMEECDAEIHQTGLQLWVAPHLKANQKTTLLYDISGLARHGTVAPSGDVATIWHSDDLSLLFDGTNDHVAHGDVCDIDADDDFAIDFWVKVPAANGTAQEILSKYSGAIGFIVTRDVNNKIAFDYADAGEGASFPSDSTLLQNVWKHIFIAGNRSVGLTFYFNGVSDGEAASLSNMGDISNATDFYLGRSVTGYGNVQLGVVRMYNFGAAGMPSNIATIAANHFAAERTRYGV